MSQKITKQTEIEQAYALSSYAFNKPISTEGKNNFLTLTKNVDTWAVYQAQELQSMMLVLPFHVSLFGKTIKMAGIGNVATYPENRGKGGIKELFQDIFIDLKENNTILSYLAPFSQAFYRRFGYEQAIERVSYQASAATIAKIPNEKNGRVIRTNWQEKTYRPLIKQLYQATLAQENGTIQRQDWFWDYTFIQHYPQRQFALCFDDENQAQGYVIYEMVGSDFIIHELAYQQLFALKKLASFIASHAGSFQNFHYTTSTKTIVAPFFNESGEIKQTTEPYMMIKIINWQQFIEAFPFLSRPDSQVFNIGVVDDSCPWNQGSWQITIKNGQATCQQVSDQILDSLDFKGTIQAWTQVMLHYISLQQAYQMGKIVGNGSLNTFTALLPTEAPSLYDYF